MITIKKFLIGIIILGFTTPAHGGPDTINPKIHVVSEQAGIDITTDKVIKLPGIVNKESYDKFKRDMLATQGIAGDRVILINSPGGDAAYGNMMLDLMHADEETYFTAATLLKMKYLQGIATVEK